MNALKVKLKLESPVLITGVGNGDENSGRTLPYIPGGALRGALIGRYRTTQADLPVDEKAARLFFGGKVRYLNAYPDVRGIRTLPVPASWRTEKNADFDKRTEAYDFALADDARLQTPERIEKTFCRLSDEKAAEVLTPARTVSIHIGGEERGVVREGNNTVFRYEALAAGQTFAAMIVAEAAQDLTEVKDLLDQSPRLMLGGSRSAGYGHVLIESVEKADAEVPEPEPSNGWVTVTLLSDAILRDGNGQPTLDLDGTLSTRLGGKTIRRARAYVNTVQAGGFNRQWALPLPQGRALGMGSVFVYPAGEVTASELHALTAEGVGERRVEGFGRFAVNWPGWAKFTVENQISAEPPLPPERISDESRALAQEMAGRILRAWLDEALTAKASIWQVEGRVPNHQLSRLRAVVRGALMSDSKPLELIAAYFDEKHMKETARTLFYQARVKPSNDRLIDWLLERAIKADGLDHLEAANHKAPEVAGQRAAWDDTLNREYTLRLIDAVLRQKMNANRREEGEA